MARSRPGPRWRNRGGRRLGGGAGRLGPNVPAAARERQCAEAKKMQKSGPRVAAHLPSPEAGLVWPRDDRARLRPRHRLRLPADRPRHLRSRRGLRLPCWVPRAPRRGTGPREAARARRGTRGGPDRGRLADPHERQGGSRGARRTRLRRGPRAGDGPERGPLRRALDEPPGRAGSPGDPPGPQPAERAARRSRATPGSGLAARQGPGPRYGGPPGPRRARSGRGDAPAAHVARAPLPRCRGGALKRLLAGLALAGLAAAALGLARQALAPLDPAGEDQVFEVAPGESLPEIARRLEEARLVRTRLAVELVGRSRDLAGRLQRGEYSLSPAQSPAEILEQIASGRVITHEVSFPEGFTATQFAERLAHAGLADRDAFLAVVRDPATPRLLGVEGSSLEG